MAMVIVQAAAGEWLKTIRLLFSLLLLHFAASSAAGLPPEFDAGQMAADLRQEGHLVEGVEILKWKIQVDDRPLYLESALLIARDGRGWALIHVYRHPKHSNPPPRWRISSVTDVPYEGQRFYVNKPSRHALREFEKATWWKDEATKGFRLLDWGVNDAAMKALRE